jgi:hypothetical protein
MPARNGAPAADSSGGDEPRPYEPRSFRMETIQESGGILATWNQQQPQTRDSAGGGAAVAPLTCSVGSPRNAAESVDLLPAQPPIMLPATCFMAMAICRLPGAGYGVRVSGLRGSSSKIWGWVACAVWVSWDYYEKIQRQRKPEVDRWAAQGKAMDCVLEEQAFLATTAGPSCARDGITFPQR